MTMSSRGFDDGKRRTAGGIKQVGCTEIDEYRLQVARSYNDVGRLHIPMEYSVLMGVAQSVEFRSQTSTS